MTRQYLRILVVGMVVSLSAATAHAVTPGDYLGVSACASCHKDVVQGWKSTPHASAFAVLATQGMEKQYIPECFRCHVTGAGQEGGFEDLELTPELEAVQCESCHGPGRAHVEAQGDPGRIVGRPDEAVCRTCHTRNQDKFFGYDYMKQWVHTAEGLPPMPRDISSAPSDPLRLGMRVLAMGQLSEGQAVERRIEVKNRSQEVIRFANLKASCASVRIGALKTVLQPGESTSLLVAYQSFHRIGRFEHYVTLFTDAKGRSAYSLKLYGTVKPIAKPIIQVEPRIVQVQGTPESVALTIRNSGTQAMPVERIVLQGSGQVVFDAGGSEALTVAPGETARLVVTIPAGAEVGNPDMLRIHTKARNVTDRGFPVLVTGGP